MRFYPYHFVVLFISAQFASTQTCYYPNGKSTDALQPCNATAAVTNCCKDSDICLTNGLCFSPGLNSVLRRGCTDKTWNSTECANICLTDEFRGADTVMTPCGGYDVFCCGQDSDARECCNSNRTIQLGTGSVMLNKTSTTTTTTVTVIGATGTNTAAGSNATSQVACKQPTNITIPLAVLLGCAAVALVGLGTDWYNKRKELARPGRSGVLLAQSQK